MAHHNGWYTYDHSPMTLLHTFDIQIPDSVQIEKSQNILRISGPLGSTGIHLEKIDPLGQNAYSYDPKTSIFRGISVSKASSGLLKKILQNKIHGVTRGYLVYLKIVGIGYRVSLENNMLVFKVGFSHDVLYTVPSSIRVFVLDPTEICLFGIEKNQVTQIASILRNIRKPTVYKGKGIRLSTEKIQLKTGKRK